MAINATEEQRQQQLAKDLANKLSLEKRFITVLNSIFRDVADLYESEIRRSNTVINVNEFAIDINAALKGQYRRTNAKFGRQIRRQLKSFVYEIETKGVNEDIASEQNQFINEQSSIKSELILGTLQQQLNEIHEDVRQQLIAEDPFNFFATQTSNEQVAEIAGDKFRELIPGKSKIISMTETQNGAEGSKFIEASLLLLAGTIEAEKEWVAILDERTRLSHAIADGQVQGLNEAFIVNGERLRYPGDTTLGASIGNVAGCRCSSLTIVR